MEATFQMLIQTKSVIFAVNVVSAVFLFSTSVDPTYHVLLSIPLVGLSASMACRAHRLMVLAYYGDEAPPPVMSLFAARGNSVVSRPILLDEAEKGTKKGVIEHDGSSGSHSF